jgi:hypothetical protein
MSTSRTQAARSLDNLKGLLDERAELHMAKKRIEEQIASLDEVIRPVLADRGAIVYNGYEHKVTKSAGRKTVDYKAMAEDYNIDLEDYTKVGAPSTRYTISKVEELD